MNSIHIFKLVSTHDYRPFIIIEKFLSAEGPRFRVCAGKWGTYEEAEKHAADLHWTINKDKLDAS